LYHYGLLLPPSALSPMLDENNDTPSAGDFKCL
jgi:hypothetical protein